MGAVKHGNDHVQVGHHIVTREGARLYAVELIIAVLRTHIDLGGFGGQGVHVAVILYVKKHVAGVPFS
jgi:hypothetical protein